MTGILVPISICVILPVSIVLIVSIAAMNGDRTRAKVLMKALETNNSIDADKLAEALKKPSKSPREVLNGRLLRGCMFSLVGLFIVIAGIANWCNGTPFSADPVTVPMVFGGASLAGGISFLIVYFVTRKQVDECTEKKVPADTEAE